MKQQFYLRHLFIFFAATIFMAIVVRAQQFDLYVLDIKSGITKKLTSIPHTGAFNPSWSNNGKKIAHDVTNLPEGQSIYITDVQTGISTPLTGGEGGNDAAWSPNGKTIALDRWEFNFDYWTTLQDLYTVSADGGSRTLVRLHSNHGSWAPNSKRIAFADNWYGYIGTRNLEDGSETFVAFGNYPSYSPNGAYIAFNGWSGGVWVVGVDSNGTATGSPVQLSSSGFGPTWANNSHSLIFVDFPGGDPDLFSISVDGGTRRRIAGRAGGFDKGDYDPAYSNNGQYVAWASFTDAAAMVQMNRSAKEEPLSKREMRLEKNYPNPFSTETRIGFHVVKPSHVNLTIYNSLGQKISTLANATYQPGDYIVSWFGKDDKGTPVTSGVYITRLEDGTTVRTQIMNLLK